MELIAMLDELEQLLKGIAMMKELTLRTTDYLVSFGECMSTRIFAAYLNKIGVKARQVLLCIFFVYAVNHCSSEHVILSICMNLQAYKYLITMEGSIESLVIASEAVFFSSHFLNSCLLVVSHCLSVFHFSVLDPPLHL
jgi:hypothetical protein